MTDEQAAEQLAQTKRRRREYRIGSPAYMILSWCIAAQTKYLKTVKGTTDLAFRLKAKAEMLRSASAAHEWFLKIEFLDEYERLVNTAKRRQLLLKLFKVEASLSNF